MIFLIQASSFDSDTNNNCCFKCNKRIFNGDGRKSQGLCFHGDCLVCCVCGEKLLKKFQKDKANNVYCRKDYSRYVYMKYLGGTRSSDTGVRGSNLGQNQSSDLKKKTKKVVQIIQAHTYTYYACGSFCLG